MNPALRHALMGFGLGALGGVGRAHFEGRPEDALRSGLTGAGVGAALGLAPHALLSGTSKEPFDPMKYTVSKVGALSPAPAQSSGAGAPPTTMGATPNPLANTTMPSTMPSPKLPPMPGVAQLRKMALDNPPRPEDLYRLFQGMKRAR